MEKTRGTGCVKISYISFDNLYKTVYAKNRIVDECVHSS